MVFLHGMRSGLRMEYSPFFAIKEREAFFMAKSKMIVCKTCGAEIAKSAKSCPHCGAKNKKPVFKRWWFWVIVIALLGSLGNSGKRTKPKEVPNNTINPSQSVSQVKTDTPTKPVATVPVATETEATHIETTVPEETVPVTTNAGLNPDFKAAMDAYASFYSEYCELLKKYMANPADLSLLTKYADMLSRAEQMDQAFEAWDEDDLNSEELKYYLDVNNRVMKMLVDIGG